MEDPTFVYCENQSVVMNASLPDSTLKSKINSTAYYFVRDISGDVKGLVQIITLKT